MDIHIRFSLRKLAVGLVPVTFLFLANQSVLSAQAETISSLEEETSLLEGDLVPQSLEIINVEEQGEKNNSEFTGLNILVESDNLAQGSENEVGPSELKNELLEVKIDNLFESTSIEIHADMEEKVIPEHEDSSLPSNLPVAVQKDMVEQPISLYTSEDGQYREIIWAQGITPPSMGQGGDFKKEVTGEFIEYTMPYEAGKGYYDANKSLDASLEDLNLCFAAVSSNMLHWWLEQNKEYVERYISEKYGADLGQQDYSLTDIRRYTDSFENQQNSRIFNLFKAYYGRRLNGFVSDALVDLFINGYPPKNQGGVNLENPDLVPDKRGGFFHEVFKEKILTDRMFSGDYLYFGNLVRNNLENQGLLGLTYRTFGTTTHIVTVWGAEYDDKGLIRAVYITDSDDQHDPIGLKRMGITRDSSGNPRLNNNIVKNSVGSYLDYVHTINLGRKHWETYFNGLEDEKQTARQKLSEAKFGLLHAIHAQEEFSDKEERSYLALIEEKYFEGLKQINQAMAKQELSEILQSALQSLRIPMKSVGQALAYDRPFGNLIVHGNSVRHDLPLGHLSIHGDSVRYDLPLGHLSIHGDSVKYDLPLGHLSLHGSSVTHEQPVGHLSLHGSSVSHELPVGHLFLHGSSVTHELPVGHLSHGSSVSHELPVGHLSLHGSLVSHELPVGHLSLHGFSVSHELPVGHLSLHGSSVSHELPVGHLSLHGSSVPHELPVGALSSSEDLVADKLEHVTVENTEIDDTGREIVNQIISLSNEYSGKISIRPTLNMRKNGYKNTNFSSELIEEQETVGQASSIGLPRTFNQSPEPDFQVEKDSEKEQVTPSTSISSNNQDLGKGSEKAVAKGDEKDSQEKETADQTPYLIAFSLLGIGTVSYWLLFHKMIKVNKS
ncbi:IdeS/Mac family cysteine endopeptidase [Streptococcus suis]|uniref:IdeS/Mac family cysteine endopeptidase n=1 Tax=Streptococcus suis TaxID=1307 RepID=UPI000696746B|nr:IdeS/Mac family cysteine endopeptidase [Streptococcus suis]CYV05986.1 Mac family protein [Streptococcus suis]CYV41598.1 Mac family protein [Streptococcus suis]